MEEIKTSDLDGIEDNAEDLLPEYGSGVDQSKDLLAHRWKRFRSTVWMVLAVTSTLTARRVLRNGFPYPIYFLLLLQITAYCCVAVIMVVSHIRNLKTPNRKQVHVIRRWQDTLVQGVIVVLCSSISGVGMIYSVQSVMRYPSLPALAMLPNLTYICDSLILHAAHFSRLLKREKTYTFFRFIGVVFVFLCYGLAVFDDYKLNLLALRFALTSFFLESLSSAIAKVSLKPTQQINGNSALDAYLWAGIAPLAISACATSKFENIVATSHIIGSWSFLTYLKNLAPGAILLMVFNGSMNGVYRLPSHESARSALEDLSPQAREAVSTTLQAGFWIMVIGVLGKEVNAIGWLQTIAILVLYVIAVGPVSIGYYLPRLFNFIAHLLRRKQRPIKLKSWSLLAFLGISTIIWGSLVSTIAMYWVNSIAYKRNAKTWFDVGTPVLDTDYRPPSIRGFDIIIAHSAGHPASSVLDLISSMTSIGGIQGLGPMITVYTKDSNLLKTNATQVKGDFEGYFNINELKNIGGIAGTYLHHILETWESLPVQTLFLSTTKNTTSRLLTPLYASRLESYFSGQGFPIPDAEPKSGFLSLGEQEVCQCDSCFDSHGWNDTFNLIPSMWSAARHGNIACDSVLLTYSNNFATSAARIKGVKKDVWKLLYDALTNGDIRNAWAHEPEKLPKMLPGEEKVGRWAEGGIYGEADSLENPYLGLTVERLWGILLQCSTPHIAWKCPNLWRGWRRGGERADCGCIDEGVSGFN